MIVILGGGLAGLATAYFLREQPHVVLEADATPGGLCRSRTIDGFSFDYTGHLLHVRDPRVMSLLDELWPGVFEVVERRAAIRTRGVTLPFPFQANLHGLPPDVIADCILGAAEAATHELPSDPTISFHDWSLAVLGRGISEAFMFPYNAKLFRIDPANMTADWVSWAIPRPNLAEVVRGALGLGNRGMGYNATFRYPKVGGIEAVPNAFASRLSTVRTGSVVTGVDLARKVVTLEGGESIRFDTLVSTIPLPHLLRMVQGGGFDGGRWADRLRWSVVGCLNLGIDRPDVGGGIHWMYFPGTEAPFYRVGFPHAMSHAVAPAGASSMYVEFGLTRDEHPDPATLEAATLAALRSEGILQPGDRVIARDWIRIDPGYVVFDRDRQDVMSEVIPKLTEKGVHTIGRYGAWTYSYMERAILDGLETADLLARGA